ncbi:AI-2E family transporter [Helicobacter pametensis]|uniref:AI-2E family transporter n=1 Tax=Helicobacter pametensis TaxID=95149 RepID=UPI0004879F05|nr:AI-2E family transporter [Helicobacter pametensis]
MKPIYFFWIVFIASVYAMAQLYHAFLLNMLIAFLLCVCTYFLKDFFDRYLKWNWLSSLASVTIVVASFILPLYFIATKGFHFLSTLDQASFNHFIDSTKAEILLWLSDFPGIAAKIKTFLNEFSGNSILGHALSMSASIAKWSVAFLTNLGFIVVFMYFFFYYAKSFSNYILKLIPLSLDQTMGIYNEVSGVLNVVFFTSLINIFLQGFCFGVMSYFFGYDGLLLGILYGIASLVPIVGGALVWIPAAFYQLYLKDTSGAIFIAIYGAIFIGIVIDNIIKPILISIVNKHLIKTSITINEMLIFFAILAGLNVFGFAGIIIGPAATALFIALLRIYDANFRN